MKRRSIEEKLNNIRYNMAPIQFEPVLKFIDLIYPDDISTVADINYNDNGYNVNIDYYAYGIRVIVKIHTIVVVDFIKNTSVSFKFLDKCLTAVAELVAQRESLPQTMIIKSILNRFDGEKEWISSWFKIHIFIQNESGINVVVRSKKASITLYYKEFVVDSTSELNVDSNIDSTNAIIDQIIYYLNSADELVKKFKDSIYGKHTTVHNNASVNTNIDTNASNNISVSSDITPTRINLSKISNASTIESLKNVITDLLNIKNEQCQGTFSDGWKEALVTVMNRIDKLK